MCVMLQMWLLLVVYCTTCEVHGDAFNEERMEGVDRQDLRCSPASGSRTQLSESSV